MPALGDRVFYNKWDAARFIYDHVHVDPDTGCHEVYGMSTFIGHHNCWYPQIPGRVMIHGIPEKVAHRVIYLVNRKLPKGKPCVLHSCHNTFCVNEDHLYAGTHGDNTEEMRQANRHPIIRPRGEVVPESRPFNRRGL